MHALAVKFLGLVQFESEIEQAQWRDDAETQGHAPSRAQVVLSENQDQDHGRQSRSNETEIDLQIGEHNEPAVPVALFQFAAALGCGNRPGGILSSNTNAQEEAIGGKGSEKTVRASMVTVRGGTQDREQDEDQRRNQERAFPGPVVAQNTEKEHPNNSTGERDGRDVLACGGFGIRFGVDNAKHRINGPDNLPQLVGWQAQGPRSSYPIEIAIREKTSAASNGRPAALPATFVEILEGCDFWGRGKVLANGDLFLVFDHSDEQPSKNTAGTRNSQRGKWGKKGREKKKKKEGKLDQKSKRRSGQATARSGKVEQLGRIKLGCWGLSILRNLMEFSGPASL